MPSASSPFTRVAAAVVATVTAIVISVFLTGILPVARAASPGQLRQQISAGQGRVSALSGAVSQADQRANELAASAASTVTQIARIQADLNVKRDSLLALRAKADRASQRLAQLQASERRVDGVLPQQLGGSYESASPDLVTVVVK